MSITSGGVWKPKLEFAICALVIPCWGIELTGGRVHGHCSSDPEEIEYRRLPDMLTDFLNWPDDPAAIVKFTKKYGPIVIPPRKTDTESGYTLHKLQGFTITNQLWPGQEWSFTLQEWRSMQTGLKTEWDTRAGRRNREVQPVWLGHEDMLQFHKREDRITLQVASPGRFLNISLNALPTERMKKCRRPIEQGCPTPYFVATHLRQEYCSIECAAWAQKAVKREWWKERQKQIKGGKH